MLDGNCKALGARQIGLNAIESKKSIRLESDGGRHLKDVE